MANAYVSKMKLPDDTNTYYFKDANKSGIYPVIGTQTSSTGSWTGSLHGVSSLYTGLTIAYYLPYNGVGNVTLNLTLDTGSTTGAIPCYSGANNKMLEACGAGKVYVLTYFAAGDISISGTATTDNRWICDGIEEIVQSVSLPTPIASFNTDMVGVNLPALSVDIQAKQSGSGEPSPDNIRPTIGVSECNVCNTPMPVSQLWTIDNSFNGVVNFNQQVQNGNFVDTTGWSTGGYGTLSASNNILHYVPKYGNNNVALYSSNINIVANHKYLVSLSIRFNDTLPRFNYISLSLPNSGADTIRRTDVTSLDKWYDISGIFIPNTTITTTLNTFPYCDGWTANSDSFDVKNVNLIDLTQMFGSTIADYIYSLEQGTAGAGVAFFRSIYPNDYYAYDTGTDEMVGSREGNTYTIQLGDTYYGGSLDVTTGVLTVDKGYKLFDGSDDENWTFTGTRFVAPTNDMVVQASRTEVISNIGKYDASSTSDGTIFGYNGSVYYYLSTQSTLADFRLWLASNNMQVVYPIATPITVQLTPTQVEQLLINNVWADTGDVTELKYYTDSQAIQTIDTLSKQNSGVRSVTVNDKYLRVDTNGFETDLVVPYSDTTGGVVRATMESTSTATAFVLTAPDITSLYDGLTIVAKNTVIASASGCTISLNGLDAKGIWLSQSNSACTTHWAKNVTYIFIYDATNERWELQQGRDTDANDIQTIRMYYTYFTAGSHGLMNRGLCAKLRDSDTYSSFTTTSGTGNKTYNTTDSFDLSKIYAFTGSDDIAAGATNGANTINLSYPLVNLRYSLNGVTTSSSTSVLKAKKPLYLLFDKDCKLCSPYFTQDLYNLDFDDPSDWSVEYAVLIGNTYDSYRMDLLMVNPIYKVYSREWYTDQTYGDTHLIPTFKPEYCSSIEENKLIWTNSNPHASATITGTTTTITSEYLPLYSRIRIDFFPVYAMYAAVPFYVDIPKSVNGSQAVMAFLNYAAKNGLRQFTITKLSDTSFKIDWSDGGRYDTYGSNTPTYSDGWAVPYKIYLCN